MSRKLPVLTEYRQSNLRALEQCPRRLRGSLQAGENLSTGWVGHLDDLGTVAHAVIAEILATLRRHGEVQMATEEAMVVCREVYAASEIVLPAEEHDDLLWMIRSFCAYRWRPERILAIEEPLRVDLLCEDGVTRTLKGQPDLVIADPPSGGVVVDAKSGRAKPKAPRQSPPEGETVIGVQYLTGDGKFQRQIYGLLVLHRYPAMDYVTMRELPLRFPGEAPREARLYRSELEHVEPRAAALMQKLARGIAEGPKSDVWRPKPGSHCAKCEVARSCPVPSEMRGDGALDTRPKADRAARAWAVLSAKREQIRDQLKAVHEETGYAPAVNEQQVVRWDPPVGPGRKFGIHSRVDSEGSA